MELTSLTKPSTDKLSPAAALARLRQIEGAMSAAVHELSTLRAEMEKTMVSASPSSSASLLTVEEAAAELRVGRTTVFNMIQSGDLRGVRLGKKRCVTRASLDAFVASLSAA
jgi:excisionase family DNA binding protein